MATSTTAVTTEDSPTPLVRLLAGALRRSAAAAPDALARMNGVAAVCSAHDPQAATLRFGDGRVHLEHGRADDADVVITLDLALDGLPDAPKPKVKGAAAHPRFALALGKMLEPPEPEWRPAADEFFRLIGTRPYVPPAIEFVDTTSGSRHTVGHASPGEPVYEIHGPADRIVKLCLGGAFLLEEMEAGRMTARGSMAGGVSITGAGLALGLGQIDDPSS